MAVSEEKMRIVINNYFKSECNVDTSIREAFEKGFRIGVQKGQSTSFGKEAERKTGKWILSEIQRQEDVENDNYQYHCSNCGKGDVHAKGMTVPYCWYCGAQMIGGDEDV